MVSVLESLRKEVGTSVRIDFVDVKEDNKKAEMANINLIPTQIFYDATGKEVFRHEGYFSKDDILKVMKEKGLIK